MLKKSAQVHQSMNHPTNLRTWTVDVVNKKHEFSPAELCDVLDNKIAVEIFAIELANIDVII